MQEAAVEVANAFQSQVQQYVPKFQQQGTVLVGVAKASTLKVVKIVVTLGPSIAMDLVNKGKQFASDFQDIGKQVDSLINDRAKAYIETCEERVTTTISFLKEQAEAFGQEAKGSAESLVGGMKTRFENLAIAVEADVRGLIDGVVSLVEDTAGRTEGRFKLLYAESRDAVQVTVEETREAVSQFLAEAERIFEEAIATAGTLAQAILEELKNQALAKLKEQLDTFVARVKGWYQEKLQAGRTHLLQKRDAYLVAQEASEAAEIKVRGLISEAQAAEQGAQLEIDGIEFDLARAPSPEVRTALEAKERQARTALEEARARLRTVHAEALDEIAGVVDQHLAALEDNTDCLAKLFADLIEQGRGELQGLKSRLVDEGKALAADAGLTGDAVTAQLEALRGEVAASMTTHFEAMRDGCLDSHQIELDEGLQAAEEALALLGGHVEDFEQKLKKVADPRVLLGRLREVVVPRLEEFAQQLLGGLMACYGDRLAEAPPVFADALALIQDALEGKPVVQRAWEIIQQDHLPKLREKLDEIVSQVDEKLDGHLGKARGLIADAREQFAGNVAGEILSAAEEQMSGLEARVTEGAGATRTGAQAAIDAGAEFLTQKVGADVEPARPAQGRGQRAGRGSAGQPGPGRRRGGEVRRGGGQDQRRALRGDEAGGGQGQGSQGRGGGRRGRDGEGRRHGRPDGRSRRRAAGGPAEGGDRRRGGRRGGQGRPEGGPGRGGRRPGGGAEGRSRGG
ncbi:MAG: hypothetical protein R3F43_27445 [bacterium]